MTRWNPSSFEVSVSDRKYPFCYEKSVASCQKS
jgi:hypothetical protein